LPDIYFLEWEGRRLQEEFVKPAALVAILSDERAAISFPIPGLATLRCQILYAGKSPRHIERIIIAERKSSQESLRVISEFLFSDFESLGDRSPEIFPTTMRYVWYARLPSGETAPAHNKILRLKNVKVEQG